MAAQDVHAERRQHAADVREQERLVLRHDGQLEGVTLALEKQMNLVRTHVSREPHMTIDRLGVEQLQVAPRKAFEHARDLAVGQIRRTPREERRGVSLPAGDQVVAVAHCQLVVCVDVEAPQELRLPGCQGFQAHGLDVGERQEAEHLQPILDADQLGELPDDFGILRVAPERDLGHAEVVRDEELDELRARPAAGPDARTSAAPCVRSRSHGPRRATCRRRGAAAPGPAAPATRDPGAATRSARGRAPADSRSRFRIVSSVCSSTVYLW